MVQDTTSTIFNVYSYLSELNFWITIYSIILSIIGAIKFTPVIILMWRTRKLRKVWGIKNKENVIVICSELDEPDERQNLEEREFIYNLKYGDVDAYFEVIVTLLRLYPKLKIRILSSGEAENTRFDMAQTLVLIGGPDYNKITEKILEKEITQFRYRSKYLKDLSKEFPDEIVIYHILTDKEYCDKDEYKDFGFFEKINNPHNPKKNIILLGGCHTIGVTAAIKAFSLASNEYDDIPRVVLENSKVVAKKISKKSEFAVLVKAERVGQSINTPIVNEDSVYLLKNNKT